MDRFPSPSQPEQPTQIALEAPEAGSSSPLSLFLLALFVACTAAFMWVSFAPMS